jgi:hypothetical protein
MSALLPFLTLEQTCEQVDQWVREKLTHAGLRVVPTFDLQLARLAHADCECPNHGTEACSCQMVVLLVYAQQEDPATLIIHGQDGKTWLSLATPMESHSRQSAESSVRQMLVPHYPGSIAAADATLGSR